MWGGCATFALLISSKGGDEGGTLLSHRLGSAPMEAGNPM